MNDSDILHIVMDVESIGLYGPAFAWGWVVMDWTGTELVEEWQGFYVPPLQVAAKHNLESSHDTEWVRENCSVQGCTEVADEESLREWFLLRWKDWHGPGVQLWADCAYPVETNFLNSVFKDEELRNYYSPFPLLDVSTVVTMVDGGGAREFNRLESELPRHNPVRDARQSARILSEYLERLKHLP